MKICKGLKPVHHEDGIYWSPVYLFEEFDGDWRYCIAQYAFVPGYNIVDFGENYEYNHDEVVVSNHKTMTEAKAFLTILLATPGAVKEWT